RTIRNWVSFLEENNCLVKIPIAGKICAYALDPAEVWKGYNTSTPYAAFVTKTLVNSEGVIKRRLQACFGSSEPE
ncbi:helix-turn-helix domain-containing protein, partial [Escherichia coli]|nr:helix-turn-helix domain-containing protein [Escherichia coli]